MDLGVSANPLDKLHNVHLQREMQIPGTPCQLIPPQRLLKAGECTLINVGCIPWSHRRSPETHLHLPWWGVFVSWRVTTVGEQFLPYNQKASTWVCPTCQLHRHAAFFGYLIWLQIPSDPSEFPMHPEDFLLLHSLFPETWAEVLVGASRRDPAPSPAFVSTQLGTRTAMAMQPLLCIHLGQEETKSSCFAKNEGTAPFFPQHLSVFKYSHLFMLSGGETQKVEYPTPSRHFKLVLIHNLLQAVKISLSPLIVSGSRQTLRH